MEANNIISDQTVPNNISKQEEQTTKFETGGLRVNCTRFVSIFDINQKRMPIKNSKMKRKNFRTE